jgi:ABC-type phosphate transport system substrate-binding protein
MNRGFIFMLLLLFCQLAKANDELVVVVNKNNPVQSLTKSEVIDIFMGKYIAYPNGESANPLELEDSNKIKQIFYKDLIGRSLASVNAYWARLKFTGHRRKSDTVTTEEDVVSLINKTDSAIGYIRISKLTPDLKVVYNFDE